MSATGESQRGVPAEEVSTPPAAPDHYAVLGLEPGASYAEIRRAFHAGAKQWHPDRYMSASEEERAEAERQMRALIGAYTVLADPARRAVYDATRAGHAGAEPGRHRVAWAASAASTWRDAEAHDPEDYDRIVANNDPSGVANFLGVLLGMVALGILWAVLRGASGVGAFIGLAAALVLGICALWCVADPAGLARTVERLAGRAAPPPAGERRPSRAAGQQRAEDGAGDASADEDETLAFERLVEEALAAIPAEFQAYLRNVVVRVRPEPTPAERRTMRLREGETLFGLYEGVMLTEQGAAGAGPEVITIFQRPIERACAGDPAEIREQVRRTVLHELAHHFGLDHDEMPEWIK